MCGKHGTTISYFPKPIYTLFIIFKIVFCYSQRKFNQNETNYIPFPILFTKFKPISKSKQYNESLLHKKSLEFLRSFCFLGGRRGSNPRPSVPQTDALTN